MNNLYKELKPTLIIVGIICLVTILLQFYYTGSITGNNLGKSLLYNVYYGVPLSLVNGYFFDYLNKYVAWEVYPKRRALLGVVGSIFVTMLTLLILNLILWVYIRGLSYSVLWNMENRDFYIIALVITIIVSVTIHAIGFFQEIQKERKVSQLLREEKMASELSALRNQVDPHFLFNSFNVLSGLIDEDTEKAQDFLTGLSKIYRYVLEQRNDNTSSVKDELEFAQKYLNLQQMRFENCIEINTEIGYDSLKKKIPSLSLQLLLENAIKHNGFSEAMPLKISIKEEGNVLIVSNNIQKRSNIETSAGLGLQNISDRYALLKEGKIVIDATDHEFTVKLPLI
ncbi:MAG: histidine kinase [Saprospiraceae bacterium]|nr:histidine kinase [Saprospiraceae bacterium]